MLFQKEDQDLAAMVYRVFDSNEGVNKSDQEKYR